MKTIKKKNGLKVRDSSKGIIKRRLPEDETSWLLSRSLCYEAINLCQSFQGILRKNILDIYENQQKNCHKVRDSGKGSNKTRLPEDETSWLHSRSLCYEAINLCKSFQGILRTNILNIYENQQRHGHKLRDQKLL